VRTLVWMLLLLAAVTIFTLSNPGVVAVNFLQWELVRGPLGVVVIGAGVAGALLTYLAAVGHHIRLSRQIRRLQEGARPAAPVPVPPMPASSPPAAVPAAPRPRPPEEARGAP
jgi:uncharacterized integral membrane protein